MVLETSLLKHLEIQGIIWFSGVLEVRVGVLFFILMATFAPCGATAELQPIQRRWLLSQSEKSVGFVSHNVSPVAKVPGKIHRSSSTPLKRLGGNLPIHSQALLILG